MTLTSAQRRANGKHRVEVWLRDAVVAKLDEICDASGYSRADMIETMIESDWDEWREIVGRKRQGGSESR